MMVTKYHHIVGFTMRSIGRSTAPRHSMCLLRYFLDHPLIWRIVFDAGLKSRNQVRQTRKGYMREALMGALVAAGAGLFATTTVSAAPVVNGAPIGVVTSTSLPIQLVEEHEHRREESRERHHRREESREHEHHRREESRERRHHHRREESRER
jgi:hypothetical protein